MQIADVRVCHCSYKKVPTYKLYIFYYIHIILIHHEELGTMYNHVINYCWVYITI